MQLRLPILLTLVSALCASVAFAQEEPAPAPDTFILIGSDVYAEGSSSNFTQALKHYIDYFWEPGACDAVTDCGEGPYSCCDDLRFGLGVAPGPDCSDTGPDGPLTHYFAPKEDGGADVKQKLQTLSNKRGKEFCGGGKYDGQNCNNDDDCQGTCDPGTTKCVNSGTEDLVNHDTALQRLWETTFGPNGVNSTDTELDDHWERPHLNFLLTEHLPSGMYGDPQDRVRRSLAQACTMFHGGFKYNGTACTDATVDTDCAAGQTCECPPMEPWCTTGKQCANQSGLPAMPTWVMTERKSHEKEALFGAMLAAAGGTGSCEFFDGSDWVPIDVCEHIADPTLSEATIRTRLETPEYRCGAAAGCSAADPDADCAAKPGVLDFGTSGTGTLGEIECHLFGEIGNNQCGADDPKTNLFSTFKCIRQLPRGVVADADNYVVRYCDATDNDDDVFDDDSCQVLRESQGEIEFIDDSRTMFVIVNGDGASGASCTDSTNCGGNTCFDGTCAGDPCDDSTDCEGVCVDGFCHGNNICDGGKLEAFNCPTLPCDTGLPGRCGPGMPRCPDNTPICEPIAEPYPEICNGLDDDCDGIVDNMAESWAKAEFALYEITEDDDLGKDCKQLNVCVCPAGATATHGGTTFDEFLQMSWDPSACGCGEGLGPNGDPPPASESPGEPAAPASCSAVNTSGGVPAALLGLLLAGLVGAFRRRRQS